jgi:26 proteasome complex subunit DSS1
MASSQNTPKKEEKTVAETKPEQSVTEQKPAALEEDDEFEDFPVDGPFPPPLHRAYYKQT